jgi:glutamyl-tRNA synthetase
MPDDALAAMIAPRMGRRGVSVQAPGSPDLAATCGLFKDRAGTLEELADLASMLWIEPALDNPALAAELAAQLKPEAVPALRTLADRLASCQWDRASIAAVIKDVLTAHGLKMPQVAVPVRLKVFGRAQTPSVDAMLALMSREVVLRRLG